MHRQPLHQAYLGSDYVVTTPVGTVTLRADGPPIGDPAALALVAGRRVAVVTACNPRSKQQPEPANRAANARLGRDMQVRGWSWWPAVGRERIADGADVCVPWSEASFAVLDADPDAVRQLAHTYGQNAVLMWDGERGSIVWCDACLDPHCGVTVEGAP
jgi:hypothetical protein